MLVKLLSAIFAISYVFITAPIVIKKWRKITTWVIAFLWVSFVIVDIFLTKNKDDKNDKAANEQQIKIDSLVGKISSIGGEVHYLNIYLSKLDSLGIRRDLSTNTPVITKTLRITNNINKVGTLNQY